MVSESKQCGTNADRAADTFRVWLFLVLCMGVMTAFCAYAAQTRALSPFLSNFMLIDAYVWVERLGISDTPGGLESSYWSDEISSRYTLWQGLVALPRLVSDQFGFALLFVLSPMSFIVVGFGSLALSCFLMVRSGATISPRCAVIFGCIIACNPLCWLWSIAPYKEPFGILLGSLILTVIVRARVPVWCFVLAIVLSSFGLILRIELTAFLFAILLWIFVGRLLLSDRLLATLLLILPVLVLLASVFELNRLVSNRLDLYTPQQLEKLGGSYTELMSKNAGVSERLMTNQWLRPLGVVYHGVTIMVHPFLRPLGLGDHGIYIFQFGRWISHLLCALTAISSLLVLIRWRRSSDPVALSSAVALSLLTLTCVFPVMLTRYFYPATVFVIPLLLGLPVLWRKRLLGGLLVVLLLGPLTLLLLGYPPPGLGGDKDFPAHRNPFLPGYHQENDSVEDPNGTAFERQESKAVSSRWPITLPFPPRSDLDRHAIGSYRRDV